jgi:uncharacterized lipoprotein YddW (UPF0748 family)
LKRREFVETVGGAALVSAGLRIPPAAPDLTVETWAWVHGRRIREEADWRHRFARLKAAQGQGVLVSGTDLTAPAAAARAVGLEFHRWIWILNRSGDAWAKEHHPEWYMVSREGKSSLAHPPYVPYYQWVCPSRGPVREYLRRIVDEIARGPMVDGVHLDYIRYPDVILPIALWSKYGLVQDQEYPEFDFCYCDECRRQFQELGGPDPLTLVDPPAHPAWRAFRYESVTRLVEELAATVRMHGKRITAAVFPTPTIARTLVRQAWDQWPLDAFFPMIYHRFYRESVAWIEPATRHGVRSLPPDTALYSGLYLPSLSPIEVGQAIEAAARGGARGVSLFELDRLTDEHATELGRAVERVGTRKQGGSEE